MQDASAERTEADQELPSKAARRKARKERVLGGLEAQGVVLDHKASSWMERRTMHRHEIVDLCDDDDDMSGIPLPQEAGPSTASPEVPPAAPSSRKRPLEATSDVSLEHSVARPPASVRTHVVGGPAALHPPPHPRAPLQAWWADAAPERDEPADECAEHAEAGVPSEAARPESGRHTPEPSQEPEPPEPLEAEDEAVEEAQFSDAEEGPPTPSAARDPSASLEEEKRSFALSGVVAADAWQAGG